MVPRFRRANLILNWIVFAVFIGFGFGWMGPMQDLSLADSLQSQVMHGVAQVQSVKNGDFLNSAQVNYSFTIDGRQYFGYSHLAGSKTPDLAPGSSLPVTYLPSNPSKNSVDIEGLRESGKHGLIIAGILEAIVAAIFLPLIIFSRARSVTPAGSKVTPKGNLIAGLVIISIMLCAGLSALFFGVILTYGKANRLVAEGRPAVAKINAVYDHDKGGRYAEYSFRADGITYNGQADYRGDYGDRGPLNVIYLPDDPSFSATDPGKRLTNAKQAIAFMIVWNLLAAGIFGVVLAQWRKTRIR